MERELKQTIEELSRENLVGLVTSLYERMEERETQIEDEFEVARERGTFDLSQRGQAMMDKELRTISATLNVIEDQARIRAIGFTQISEGE